MAQVHESLGKSRVEALTDGIFAFALTVLVLNIEVPSQLPVPLPAEPVMSLLTDLVPDLAHYFFAFIVLAGFWVSHHQFFNRLMYVDRTMTWLNIFGLVFIALMPFSAQLADTYIDFPLSAMVFELDVLIVGTMFFAQWIYAKRNCLFEQGADTGQASMRLLVMPGISVVALAFAASGFTWTTTLYLLTPLVMMLARESPKGRA